VVRVCGFGSNGSCTIPSTVLMWMLAMLVVNLTRELVCWVVVLQKRRGCFQEPQFHRIVSV